MVERDRLLIVRVALARPKNVFAAYFERRASSNILFTIEPMPGSQDAILRLERYSIHGITLDDIMEGIFPASSLIWGHSSKNVLLSDADRAWLELVAE